MYECNYQGKALQSVTKFFQMNKQIDFDQELCNKAKKQTSLEMCSHYGTLQQEVLESLIVVLPFLLHHHDLYSWICGHRLKIPVTVPPPLSSKEG